MDKLLTQLVQPISVSGCEKAIADTIEKLGAGLGEFARDGLGNLVLHRTGRGKRVMLAAHMDTVGLVVTYVEENGYARVGKVGGVKLMALVGQRVRFENGVIGVVCADRGVKPEELTDDRIFVDTLGEKVQIGDTAVYCGEPAFVGNKAVSPYLDNRIGCAVCLRAMQLLQDTDNDIFCTFTVQEEVGERGARPVAYTICPDYAIAVDICSIFDYPGKEKTDAMTLDGGPVVKYMDKKTICHKQVISLLEDTAKELGMPFQRLVTQTGATDACAICKSRGGVPTGVLSIPIRYTHTPNEIADLTVAEQCAKLLAAAIAR